MKGKTLENIGNPVAESGGEASECGLNQLSKEFTLGDIVWIKIHGGSWWPAQIVEGNSKSGSNNINKNLEGEICVRLYGSYECIYVDPMKYRTEFEKVLKKNNWNFGEILKKSLERDISQVKTSAGVESEVFASEGGYTDAGHDEDHIVGQALSFLEAFDCTHGVPVAESPTVEASKIEKQRQDKIPKNQVKGPSRKLQAGNAQGRKANQSNSAEKAGGESCKSESSKRQKLDTRQKADGPDSATGSSKNVQELSARRVKVMQGLGLMAPCGSPFRRNGFCKIAMP